MYLYIMTATTTGLIIVGVLLLVIFAAWIIRKRMKGGTYERLQELRRIGVIDNQELVQAATASQFPPPSPQHIDLAPPERHDIQSIRTPEYSGVLHPHQRYSVKYFLSNIGMDEKYLGYFIDLDINGLAYILTDEYYTDRIGMTKDDRLYILKKLSEIDVEPRSEATYETSFIPEG